MNDPLGIEPFGNAINCSVETASVFLKALCLPAAEEFGFYLRDKVYSWRVKNTISILKEAKQMLAIRDDLTSFHAHPRIAIKVIQEGSCVDDPDLQKMWGGLLASSCTKDGTDETNLIFINILCQISSAQARTINYLVPESMRRFYANLPDCNPVTLEVPLLHEITGLADITVLERELNYLGSLGLIRFTKVIRVHKTDRYRITIDDVTLRFCARCNGYENYAEWTRQYNLPNGNKAT